jgi:hypothetical protein
MKHQNLNKALNLKSLKCPKREPNWFVGFFRYDKITFPNSFRTENCFIRVHETNIFITLHTESKKLYLIKMAKIGNSRGYNQRNA